MPLPPLSAGASVRGAVPRLPVRRSLHRPAAPFPLLRLLSSPTTTAVIAGNPISQRPPPAATEAHPAGRHPAGAAAAAAAAAGQGQSMPADPLGRQAGRQTGRKTGSKTGGVVGARFVAGCTGSEACVDTVSRTVLTY